MVMCLAVLGKPRWITGPSKLKYCPVFYMCAAIILLNERRRVEDIVDTTDVTEQARDVIAHTFGMNSADVLDSVSTDTLSAWDSLHHFTLILALEDQFGLTYASDEIPLMTSLQAIMDITVRHLQPQTIS